MVFEGSPNAFHTNPLYDLRLGPKERDPLAGAKNAFLLENRPELSLVQGISHLKTPT